MVNIPKHTDNNLGKYHASADKKNPLKSDKNIHKAFPVDNAKNNDTLRILATTRGDLGSNCENHWTKALLSFKYNPSS